MGNQEKKKNVKNIWEYISEGGESHVSHDDYMKSPASAFLKYANEANSSVSNCLSNFKKKNNQKEYMKNAQDSLEHINSSMLPSIMGHFETYQRILFSGCFDYSGLIDKFNAKTFLKKLEKATNVNIDLFKLSAYRGIGAKSVGILLADNMGQWHSPEKVNEYFGCFDLEVNFFNNDDIINLKVLWQLRHSIVHTGGSITLSDAQKIPHLNDFGGRNIVFENHFTREITRRFHKLIKGSTERIGSKYISKIKNGTAQNQKSEIEKFFKVDSSNKGWLEI